VVRGVVE